MFNKKYSQIFTQEALIEAFEEINKSAIGVDGVSASIFKEDLQENISSLHSKLLSGNYVPEPLKKIEIPKEKSKEFRPIAIASIKDKIVQRVLYKELNDYFNPLFSNGSYAYRLGKSVIKAVNRVSDYLNRGYLVALKSDIDDFFENIDHNLLLKFLKEHIEDREILHLISLFLKIGSFAKIDYVAHTLGVHQGDILSPLLSNIYLDKMDKYLDSKEIPFVRYGDDFVVLNKTKDEAIKVKKELIEFLKKLNLSLNQEKTYIAHIKDGFSFLGVEFIGKNRFIDNERFHKSISNLHKLAKKDSSFKEYIKELNSYLYAIKNYYLKIINNNQTQLNILKEHLLESIAQKIAKVRLKKELKSKKAFKELLKEAKLEIIFTQDLKEQIEFILALAKQKYLFYKSESVDPNQKIKKKVNKYTKKFAKDSTLHIAEPGLFLGISKNKFVVKKYGKIYKSFPISTIKRIILEGKGYSLSSNVIKKAAKENISIDFIDRDYNPYASLISYKASLAQNAIKQIELLNTPKQLELASMFIRGKAKNQLNYLKYQNKYHKILNEHINKIEAIIPKIKMAKSSSELMGIEGSISAVYWDGVKLFLDAPFEARVTKGARDLVNSSLNYGYAILYGVVQQALVEAGLSLHISYLHSLDRTKPTLTFDFIEEFRTFIVDRTIFAIINRNEPIKLNKEGLLNKKSRLLIAQNIKETLGSYISWRKEYRQMQNIIKIQAYNLAEVINNPRKKYKPFIGKY